MHAQVLLSLKKKSVCLLLIFNLNAGVFFPVSFFVLAIKGQ